MEQFDSKNTVVRNSALRSSNHECDGKHGDCHAHEDVGRQRLAKDKSAHEDSRNGLEHAQHRSLGAPPMVRVATASVCVDTRVGRTASPPRWRQSDTVEMPAVRGQPEVTAFPRPATTMNNA